MSRKTVFVIGAGASKEANLPTELELKSKIAQLLDIRFPDGYDQKSGDYTICEAFRLIVRKKVVKMEILIPICMKHGM